jgi:pyruvate/2-oxoacid:ferredoxin oxidoreductase alpha subunit
MARLLWVRPFPSDDLRDALRGVKAVGVVETNLGLGGASYGGILSLDVTTALSASAVRRGGPFGRYRRRARPRPALPA